MDYYCFKIRVLVFLALLMIHLMPFSNGFTDPRDVFAMNSLYVALENPPLPGWIPNGGDPCLELWQGVECVNSNITGIVLSGANLGGVLSNNLDLFTSMIVIDLSNNHIGGSMPVNLPLTVRNISLSANQFTGSIPNSLKLLSQLTDMSFSNNHLTGEIPDAFQTLTSLVNLDLSGNNLSGLLPSSLKSLLSLTTLQVQNNHLSGTLDFLQDLPLRDLNIENNIFSGPIPENLVRIPNFIKDGNPFNTTVIPFPPSPGPTLPLPPLSGPAVSGQIPVNGTNGPSASEGPSHEFWKTKKFVWWVIGVASVLSVIGLGLLVLMSRRKRKRSSRSKMSGPSGRMKKSEDIKSELRTNNETEKVRKTAIVGTKDEHGSSVSRMGAIPNQKRKDKADVKTVGIFPKQYQESEKGITGLDSTLMPPPLAATEKHNISPVLFTIPNTGKLLIKSVDRAIPVRIFTVASLQQYTNSFSQENLIGGGTLGSVYRAELPDGKLLAVKKLDNMPSALQNDKEFLDLVANISRLQNRNIMELEGYCVEHGQRLLIYGYCSNGTLHDALHSDGLTKKLSWNARIRISLGAARALEYMHEVCHPPIVHRNFKSANILLDEDLAVRVSDCGLAPLISAASSQLLGQSYDYGAPELEMGTYSCQSDVYSFGVVMLELLTGRKSYDSSMPRGEQFLVRWAIPQLHDIDSLSRMVDPYLKGAYPAKSLSRFADTISMCIQSEPEFRPPMSEIVQNLLNMIQRGPPSSR